MIIGAMNHPGQDLFRQIEWIAGMGFDFIDLTLEPPGASARTINRSALRDAIEAHRLKVVGHTAYYLPLCSPFESLRRAAVDELKVCLEVFAAAGASWMNLHPDRQAPFSDRKFIIEQNIKTIREVIAAGREFGIGIMIENLPNGFNNVRQLEELFGAIPELGFHLDIGHANLIVEHNTTEELLKAFGRRLCHVHLHDNKGGSADLHLPLGAGNLDVSRYVRALQETGYDGTITLEVFTPDARHLVYSRDVLRRIWDESRPRAGQRTVQTPNVAVAAPSCCTA